MCSTFIDVMQNVASVMDKIAAVTKWGWSQS